MHRLTVRPIALVRRSVPAGIVTTSHGRRRILSPSARSIWSAPSTTRHSSSGLPGRCHRYSPLEVASRGRLSLTRLMTTLRYASLLAAPSVRRLRTSSDGYSGGSESERTWWGEGGRSADSSWWQAVGDGRVAFAEYRTITTGGDHDELTSVFSREGHPGPMSRAGVRADVTRAHIAMAARSRRVC